MSDSRTPEQEAPTPQARIHAVLARELGRLEIDDLLSDFQRACETVVVRGDSHVSETTKHRALLRNDLRAKLLERASLLADKERLDWLEANPHGAACRHAREWSVAPVNTYAHNHRGLTLRDALDAARSALPPRTSEMPDNG
jgi:hypothetical protein